MTEARASAAATMLLSRAFLFAAERHQHQRRKGDAAEPYVNHLAEVAALVAEATEGSDPGLVAAALLHDVVEDTATTRAEVAATFGEDVAGLVAEVTDDKSLPKAERKRRQVEHAPSKSRRAKMLKLADKTSNLRALAQSPPAKWPVERRLAYVAWAREVVDGLRGVSPELEAIFDETALKAEAACKA
ncbi:MAG: HD domain-containing protein [Geminicoccaceae bacterium]